MDNMAFVRGAAERKFSVISDLNRRIWQAAEGGYEEKESCRAIVEALRQERFQVTEGAGGIPTAIEATFGSGRPVIGILGEYDALPGLSQQAGVAEPCPVPGKTWGHGCGHCALGAGAVGAAIIVKEWLEATGTTGTVKFFGCPAEENGFGKGFMAREGCFSGLDAVFSWHPAARNMPFAWRMLANYKVRFDFTGRSAHAANCPEQGRSALDACELMNVGANYLREHITTQARLHYAYLDCGGEAPNVVQAHASLLYVVRAPKLSDCTDILERLKKIAQGAALMTETSVSCTVLGGMSDMIPNPTLSALLSDCLVKLGGPDFGEEDFAVARRYLDILSPEQRARVIAEGAKLNGVSEEEFARHPLHTGTIPFMPGMLKRVVPGSTDVGDVSYQVPTAQINTAAALIGTDAHTWQYTGQVGTGLGDRSAQAAARAIALACAAVYEDPSVAAKAKEELLEETGGQYNCPIPAELSYTDLIASQN